MKEQELIPHLFRTEYRKMIAVLIKKFGIEHLETAEDLVADTFLLAAETWGLKGLPQNPTAWLYTVAKNKTKDVLKRNVIYTAKVMHELKEQTQHAVEFEIDWSNKNINDSQLQMMFAICHPAIPSESQIGLSLSILCGFGAEEIADAFLTTRDTIYKRLARAKERLRSDHIKVELPSITEIANRLDNVLTTVYLLFSEGYYSTSKNTTLRKDLCLEAMRLNQLLLENESTNIPAANALMALMCFHASRFEARTNQQGEIVLYEEQDETLWNAELIVQGESYLNKASVGNKLTRYHLEAAIAFWHTQKQDSKEKWENILQLYNRLLQIAYSPIAALNRTYALAKANGTAEAIREAEKLNLSDDHLYHSLLANLYAAVDPHKAKAHLIQALSLAKTEAERSIISARLTAL